MYDWVTSYLNNRQQSVQLDKPRSTNQTIRNYSRSVVVYLYLNNPNKGVLSIKVLLLGTL